MEAYNDAIYQVSYMLMPRGIEHSGQDNVKGNLSYLWIIKLQLLVNCRQNLLDSTIKPWVDFQSYLGSSTRGDIVACKKRENQVDKANKEHETEFNESLQPPVGFCQNLRRQQYSIVPTQNKKSWLHCVPQSFILIFFLLVKLGLGFFFLYLFKVKFGVTGFSPVWSRKKKKRLGQATYHLKPVAPSCWDYFCSKAYYMPWVK